MTLAAGVRLGPYEILSPLGAGGMGEVYRARDVKLHRDVAIKVLPEAVAADPERLARFEREAQVLAALNHPHIAAIHGVEQADGIRALVLELVPGETLAERIAAGPIPVDEALAIARQIADALEAAHARGIVHRDLKPANVKITPDGGVKVLDFGLAKALSVDGSAPDVTHSPTLTAQATQAGVVMGTAAYMSPEQARGKPIDKRSDVWSFGAVLYEMLTGRRCFEGETVSDVLASVLRQDPDWSRLPPETPGGVRVLLRRCLERDPRQRLRDLGDAWILADSAPAPASVAAAPPRRFSPWLVVAGIALALAAGFAAGRWSPRTGAAPAAASAVHSVVALPAGTRLTGWASPVLAISRDGRTLAFVAQKEGERGMLWVHRLDTDEARAVPDSATAEGPFFSPDGQWVGFATNVSGDAANGTGALRKFSLATGLTQVVARIPDYYGGTWGDDGSIVLAPSTTEGLWRIPADGGSPDTSLESVVWRGKPARRALQWPQRISPQLVLLCDEGDSPWGGAGVVDVASRSLERVAPEVSFARYTSDGHVLLLRPDRTLMAAPFDLSRRRTTGPAVAILKDVANGGNGAGALAVSDNGTLVYAAGYIRGSGIEPNRLVRLTQKGEVEALPFAADSFGREATPSPDGKRLAVITLDGSVWIYDLVRQVRARLPLAGRRAQGWGVAWSPDGSSIAYAASAEGAPGWSVCRQRSDGAGPPEEIVPGGEEKIPLDWTPDGKSVMVTLYGRSPGLLVASVAAGTPTRKLVDGQVFYASVSPDGRRLAYDYRDPEGWHSVIEPLGGSGPRVPLGAGVRWPRWSPDGRSLYCWRDDRLLRVSISPGEHVEPGQPVELFRVAGVRGYSVSPDDKGFYGVLEPADAGIVRELHLVTNWFSELERLSPAGK